MTNQKSTPDEKMSQTSAAETRPKATGFFDKIRQELQPRQIHPTKAAETVIMDEEANTDTILRTIFDSQP